MVTRSEATAGRWDVLGPQRLVDRGWVPFGGPRSSQSAKLVPGPHQANQDHKNKWEIPADKALGPTDVDYDPTRHKVAWLEARISYYSGGHFDSKYSPPVVNGEVPMRHWYASEIGFHSGTYRPKQGGGWELNGSGPLVPDFTLTGHDLPLPNWTLAKVPPINTGDRSEFQQRAVELDFLNEAQAKLIFDKGGAWKEVAKEREIRPFRSADHVLDFLDQAAQRPKPPKEVRAFTRVLERLFDAHAIRINP